MREYLINYLAGFLLLFMTGGFLSAQEVRTPMMGWSSWNANRININESLIKATADSVVSLGLKDAGYTWVNTDDGFFGGRDADGKLLVNSKFPNGMRAIADYIHSKGLKAGIYSEAGHNTCAYKWDNDTKNGKDAGLKGHEEQDLRLFFDTWDFEFIKVDYCGAEDEKLNEKNTYTNIANHIKTIATESGKDIRYNVCRWVFPGTWVTEIADSWRVHGDINPNFASIKAIIEKNTYLSAYCSSGHFNDMDMMQLGQGMSVDEEKTHFGIWCMLNSPLMIGCNLKGIKLSTLNILKNTEVIALNQDTLCIQAQIVARDGDAMVFAKPIEKANGKIRAVALFNGTNAAKNMQVIFKDVQLGGKVAVRDLWAHADVGQFSNAYETSVPAHGTAILRLEGETAFDKTRYQGEDAFLNDYNAISLSSNARCEKAGGTIASGGYRLTNLGRFSTNWAEFRNVYSSTGGKYTFKLYYYCASNRNLAVIVNNNTTYTMQNLNSGDANARAEASIEITLNQGNNTIRLASPSTAWAPDIDKFELIAEGASEEPDHFDMNDETSRFPQISSSDTSNEKWYFIQFKNGNGVIQDMGENTNVLTKDFNEAETAQQWKVNLSPNPSGDFKYQIKNKSGRGLSRVSSTESQDGFYQTTSTASAMLNFDIVATTHASYSPAWELYRQGANNRHVNQYKGPGIGIRISEWTANNENNPLVFVPVKQNTAEDKVKISDSSHTKIFVRNKTWTVENNNIARVDVYTITGQKVYEKTEPPFSFRLPALGCYLVAVKDHNHQMETTKIVNNEL
jgi:hypothetical protein